MNNELREIMLSQLRVDIMEFEYLLKDYSNRKLMYKLQVRIETIQNLLGEDIPVYLCNKIDNILYLEVM